MITRLLLPLLMLTLLTQNSFSQAGKLDGSFGENGIVKIPFLSPEQVIVARKLIVQANDKILVPVSGDPFGIRDGLFDAYLYRINKNGKIDSTFASNGRKVLHTGSAKFYLYDVISDADNRIVVATSIEKSNTGFELIRFLENGDRDSSFGINGVAIVHNPNNIYGDEPFPADSMLSLQPDGKILASCSYHPHDYYRSNSSVLYRFTENGLLDSSFNNDGHVFVYNPSYTDYPDGDVYSYTLTQPNNKILYAGTAIIQLNANGSKNKSFAGDGKIYDDSTLYDGVFFKERFSNIKRLPGGGFMCIGNFSVVDRYIQGTLTFKLYKFKEDGTPDSSFNGSGELQVARSGVPYDTYPPAPLVNFLTIQPDGKFIVTNGFFYLRAASGYTYISRYMPDGSIDSSFANGAIKKYGHEIAGISLQKDLKVVMLENIKSTSTDTAYFYLYRYKNDALSNSPITLSGVNNSQSKSTLAIYPNPATDVLSITGLTGIAHLSIVNTNGRVVAITAANTTTYKWNIHKLVAGNYFVLVNQNNSKPVSLKFVKQ